MKDLTRVKYGDIVNLSCEEGIFPVEVIRETIRLLECDVSRISSLNNNTMLFSRKNGLQKGAFSLKRFDAPKIEAIG